MSYDFTLFDQKAHKTMEHVQQEMATLRTGRASIQMLDAVRVEAYGTTMSVSEVASISVPDPSLLIISPWDKSLLSAIEKGVLAANLNLQPIVDKEVIRIAVPMLTEERRKEMVKVLSSRIEDGRVMLRNVRNDCKKDIEKQKDAGHISEDVIKTELETLEKKVKELMEKLDHMFADKERDLLKV